jgi:hypothetical protein
MQKILQWFDFVLFVICELTYTADYAFFLTVSSKTNEIGNFIVILASNLIEVDMGEELRHGF